jgi:hypothetical protein
MSIWGPIIGAGIGALGSLFGSRQQASAARDAADMQWRQYAQQREDMMPWLEQGRNALAMLAPQVAAPFQVTPGYQWNLAEGQRAINANMAARGLLDSTARGRALARYSQGLAAQEYNNYLNRLAALAGVGQTAAGNLGMAGAGAAGAAGQALTHAGGAAGAGTVGAFNALARGLENYALMAAKGQKPGTAIW